MNKEKEESGYIFRNAVWCLAAMIWYRSLLFRSLPQKTYSESKLILWLILLAFLGIEIAVTVKNGRSEQHICSNILIIYGTYTYFSYYRTFPILYQAVAMAALAAFVVLTCVGSFRKTNKHENSDTRSRVGRACFRLRIVASVACAILMIPMIVCRVFGDSMVWKTVSASRVNDASRWTVSANMETVCNLREDVWSGLSAREKIDTLQTIANIESQYLGLPHELNVIISRDSESTVASYDDDTHLILINIEHMDDLTAHDALNSLCHECYHSYQHRLCDAYRDIDPAYSELLVFSDILKYQAEFADYIDGDDDPMGYFNQLCERRARQYARQSVEEYYSRIEEYPDR